jgi:WhiB family redox-sensing transcriptional regulator
MENEWMAQGNCAERPPELFFPSDGVGVELAKRICSTCDVQDMCLEYALHNRIDHGVWGGTSERQRRRILKTRRLEYERRQRQMSRR